MTNAFTGNSMDRISNSVQFTERFTRTSKDNFRSRLNDGVVNWDAIANEDIVAETYGEVELLTTDRLTRSGVTVQAFSPVNVFTDDRFVITPVAMQNAPETGVRWYVIAPRVGGTITCLAPGAQCGLQTPGTTPITYKLTFDPAKFQKVGGDPELNYEWLTDSEGHELAQILGDPCSWRVTSVRRDNVGANFNWTFTQSFGNGVWNAVNGDQLLWTAIGMSDGQATVDIQYAADNPGLPPTLGVAPIDTIAVGEVIGTAKPAPSGTFDPCDLLGRVQAIEDLLGIGPVSP